MSPRHREINGGVTVNFGIRLPSKRVCKWQNRFLYCCGTRIGFYPQDMIVLPTHIQYVIVAKVLTQGVIRFLSVDQLHRTLFAKPLLWVGTHCSVSRADCIIKHGKYRILIVFAVFYKFYLFCTLRVGCYNSPGNKNRHPQYTYSVSSTVTTRPCCLCRQRRFKEPFRRINPIRLIKFTSIWQTV